MPWLSTAAAFGPPKNSQRNLKYPFKAAMVAKYCLNYLFDMLNETGLCQNFPQLSLRRNSKRIDILPDWSFEQKGNLRNHRNMLPQGMKAHLKSVVLIYLVNWCTFRLNDSEESLDDWWFSRTCSTYYSYFLSWINFEGNIFENQRKILFILCREVSRVKRRSSWPLLVIVFINLGCLYLLLEPNRFVIGCS